ncbi:MAG TPA: hypothetical protein PKX46_00070 [Clostridia bacterium]|nr:hypothetical protein [Clostridia bacterium]
MQSVDTRALDALSRDIDKLLREAPRMRRELHEELAEVMKRTVDTSIAGALNDSHGKIQSWQERYVGTGGGYAVVRPLKGETGPNSPGAITNYLESGHKIRSATTSAKRRRRSRARMAYVDGRHFYSQSAKDVEAPAIAAAQKLVDRMAKILEG